MLGGVLGCLLAAMHLPADQVAMQNGDRYFGKLVSVSADTVVLDSEMLGRIKVSRKYVASLVLGTNRMEQITATNRPAELASVPGTNSPASPATNQVWSVELSHATGTTNVIQQIRDQLLAGNPQATGKFNEMVAGYMSGKLSVADIRREAQAVADQTRALKRELGPDADDSLDGYLSVLDAFLEESAPTAGATNSPPAAPRAGK